MREGCVHMKDGTDGMGGMHGMGVMTYAAFFKTFIFMP
jgi:hypothetical protein